MSRRVEMMCKTLAVCLSLFVACVSARAEHGEGTTQVRPVANEVVQQAIDEVLSACQPGRGGAIDPSVQAGINNDIFGSQPRVEQTSGPAILAATCFKCHADKKGLENNPQEVAKWIASIESGRMPKNKYPFVGSEKQALLDYLKERD